ncbi:MAG TPA: protein kinase [Gemmatimonadales bacterium]|jgi:eukaryotic-like serine/threonine-protein kinase
MPDTLRDRLQAALGSHYTLERELSGGMSRVFVATEAALGRRVVVKVLPPERTFGVNVDRFHREIQVAAQLQHPHIVPILHAGEADGLLYYTMPFVAGESLRARMAARPGPLPTPEAVRVLRDVASGLAFAHGLGIVHRDIKPDNVLLAGDSATLADFGIAKALSAAASPDAALTTAGMTLGTPAYMAPEQATGDGSIDHRADLYSLGAMAYEILTGELPFIRATPQGVMVAHAIERPASLAARRPDLPPALCGLVMRLMEKRPEDRPQSAEEVTRLLDGVATPSGGSATVRVVRARPKRRWAYVAAAAVAVVALAALVWSRRGVATASAAERRPVLLTEFSARSADSTLANIVTEALRSDLSQSPAVVLLSSDRVAEALARSGRDRGARVDLALGRELAQREGAVATVGGEVSEVGGQVLFLARIVDPTSGEDLGSLRETARDSSDVLAGIDRLSRGVRQKLGESARTLKASPALARATTTSVEALRKYTQALTLKEDAATEDEAATLLEEAVRQDTGFALAWRELYDLRPTGSGQWEALQHAMANRERLSPAERAFTEATYADYVDNYQDEVTALRTVVRLDPGNATAWGNLAKVLLVRMPDDEGALDAARKALEASGHAPGRFMAVINAELANRHTEAARRVLDSLRLTAPDSPDAVLAQIAWHTHFGDYAIADSIAAVAQGDPSSTGWSLIRRNLRLLQGRPAEAEIYQRRYTQFLTQQGRPETALWNEFAYAQLLSRVEGTGPTIQKRLDEALRRWPPQKMNPLDPRYIFMASSAAWSGRPALARGLLARWIAVQPVATDSLGIYWVEGDIALAERRYADAARFMGRAGDMTPGAENYYPHRAHPHDLLGNVDSTIALYQAYLGRVSRLEERLYWLDPAHLSETYEALGRNFELRGQADSSAKYYQALLDMWKNAEPSLDPKKAAIKQALARVTAEKVSP